MLQYNKMRAKQFSPIRTAKLMEKQTEKLNVVMLCHARLTPDQLSFLG